MAGRIIPGEVVSEAGGGLDKMLEVVAGAPDPAASHAFLLVISGTDPGRLHVIDQPEMIIGRSRFADIHISERALSQQHCKLVRHGDTHRIFDLGSTNGTYVNDVKIQQTDLRQGDVVRTGETKFTYMTGNQEAAEHTLSLPPGVGPAAQPGAGPIPGPMGAGVPHHSVGQSMPHGAGGGALVRRPPEALYQPPAAVGYAGSPQILEVPAPVEEEGGADLLTWVLRGIEFFRRYWLSILLLTLLGGGLGAASYKVKKPPAQAGFEISVVPLAADNPVENRRRMNFEFFRNAKTNFTRPGLIAESLRQVGETDVTPDRVRAVQASLKLAKSDQFAFKGSYDAPTPEEAIEFLEVHLKLYRDAEIEKALRVLQVEAETLEEELAKAEEQLNATDEALLAFKQENSEGLPEAASHLYRELIELGGRKSAAAAAVAQAQNEMNMYKKRLKDESPEIESRIEEARPYQAGIAEVKRRLVSLRSEGKGEQHPEVVAAKEELQALETLRDATISTSNTRIIKSKNPVYRVARNQFDQAQTDYKNALAEMTQTTKDLGRAEELVENLPRLEAEYAELRRTYDATQKSHGQLFTKLNQVRVRLELERAQAAARYEVTTPPNVKPVSKMMTIVIRGAIGTFVGFFLGFGLGLVRDLRRYIAARLATT